MNTGFILGCCLFCCAALCAAFALRQRKKTRTILEKLLQELDDAAAGNLQEPVYDETLDAAIRERLNRVVQIAGMQRDEARRERDTVKSLISDISHQVRTPLSNILLYAQLLEERLNDGAEEAGASDTAFGETAPERTENIRLASKIRRQSEKLDFFIRELVRSSYAEQEMLALLPQRVSAEDLIEQACQSVEVAAMKKGIRILRREGGAAKSDTAPERAALQKHAGDTGNTDLLCYADPKWTVEALANILDNAVKYSGEGAEIRISVISYEAFVCIETADSGIGIAEEEQGAIFGRFYRSPQVGDIPGVGIGLYLVREILSRQGGYVKVRSARGQGAVFSVFLSKLSPLRKI